MTKETPVKLLQTLFQWVKASLVSAFFMVLMLSNVTATKLLFFFSLIHGGAMNFRLSCLDLLLQLSKIIKLET